MYKQKPFFAFFFPWRRPQSIPTVIRCRWCKRAEEKARSCMVQESLGPAAIGASAGLKLREQIKIHNFVDK